MSQNENTINNDLGKNILIFLLIVFVGYLLYCEYKNKENFKKLKENMTNVEKFTGGEGITESIKNLGLLASKIQGAEGVLDLTGIDLKVNTIKIGDDNKHGMLFWNRDIDAFEINSKSDNMRLWTGNKGGIDIYGNKIKMFKDLKLEKEVHFKNGSVIKEFKDHGLELWPKKEGGKTGEVHIKADNGGNGEHNGDSEKGKHKYFKGHQSFIIKPGIQEINFNLGSIIKEWPLNGLELWSRKIIDINDIKKGNMEAPIYAKSNVTFDKNTTFNQNTTFNGTNSFNGGGFSFFNNYSLFNHKIELRKYHNRTTNSYSSIMLHDPTDQVHTSDNKRRLSFWGRN